MRTHYAFVIAYNDFFLGYVALFGFSVFTLRVESRILGAVLLRVSPFER